jgi:hypothetical protein
VRVPSTGSVSVIVRLVERLPGASIGPASR